VILWTEINGAYRTKLCVVSDMSGNKYEYTIPMPQKEFTEAFNRWKGGEFIQNAFPNLSAADREVIKTGISPAEWEDLE